MKSLQYTHFCNDHIPPLKKLYGQTVVSQVAGILEGKNYGIVGNLPNGGIVAVQLFPSPEEADAWIAGRREEEKYAEYDAWREKIEGWKAEIKALDEAAKKDRTNLTGERLHNPDGAPSLYNSRTEEYIFGKYRKKTAIEWLQTVYKPLIKTGAFFQDDLRAVDTKFVKNIGKVLGREGRSLSEFFPTQSSRSLLELERIAPGENSKKLRRLGYAAFRRGL